MRSLARVVVVCGIAVALTAATVGSAFFGVRTWLTLVPLVGGLAAALLGAVAGLRGEALDATLRKERARLVAECALAAALAVVANAAALAWPATVDVTASRKNTLAEASAQVAKELRERNAEIRIVGTLDAGDRAWIDLEDLVARFTQAGAPLALSRVSPDDDPAAAQLEARVLVTSGDRRRRIRFNPGAPDQEAVLLKALRDVAIDARARVYVLAGHEEPGVGDDAPAGLRRFGQALVDEGLEVVPLPFASVGRVPDDAAAVVVAGAHELPAAEAQALQAWVDAGGRLLVLLEPGVNAGLDAMLGALGMQADNDVVIDGSAFSGLLGGPETATGVAYANHPVTSKLGAAMTHFPRARSLSVNPGTPVEPQPLVQTGAEAFGEMSTTAGQPPSLDDGDVKGPVTLALASELEPVSGGKAARPGRVVVVGDTTFATNQGIGLGANQDFAINAVLWLVSHDDAIAVRPNARGGNLLLLTPTARERIAFVLLYGLPVLLLCLGLGVTAVRRRR